jgi:hypothetical protein
MIDIKNMPDDMLVLKKIQTKRTPNRDENYYNLLCEEVKNRNLDESNILSSLFAEIK